MGARDDAENDRYLDIYKEENRKVEKCIYQRKREVNEQFGRKMNQDVDENRKLF